MGGRPGAETGETREKEVKVLKSYQGNKIRFLK